MTGTYKEARTRQEQDKIYLPPALYVLCALKLVVENGGLTERTHSIPHEAPTSTQIDQSELCRPFWIYSCSAEDICLTRREDNQNVLNLGDDPLRSFDVRFPWFLTKRSWATFLPGARKRQNDENGRAGIVLLTKNDVGSTTLDAFSQDSV